MTFVFYSFLFLFTAVYALFLLRLRAGLRFLAGEPAVERPPSLAVTIVVPLRNELDAIPDLLASLRAQTYPRELLQVLLVDDHSEDGTADAMLRNIDGDAGFQLLLLPAGMEGKKAVISFAVESAGGEIILTTDADCTHPAGWVAAMASSFAEGVDVVAGPVVYGDRSTLFKRLQALEFLGLVGVGAGFFGIGYPRLCNGANFAYRRAAFLQAGGYEGNRGIHSGDDEFLLQAIVYRQGGGARFVTDVDAVVTARPEATLYGFFRQRIRWVSKSRLSGDTRFVSFLVLLFVYFVMLTLLPAVVVYSPVSISFAIAALAAKIMLDLSVLLPAAAMFRRPLRIPDIAIAELLHPFYLVISSIIGSTGAFTWKGRRLKNH